MRIASEDAAPSRRQHWDEAHVDAAPEGFEHTTRYVKAPARDAIGDQGDVAGLVETILADVRARGGAAVRDYSVKFDSAARDRFEVTADRAAVDTIETQLRGATEFAIGNVRINPRFLIASKASGRC